MLGIAEINSTIFEHKKKIKDIKLIIANRMYMLRYPVIRSAITIQNPSEERLIYSAWTRLERKQDKILAPSKGGMGNKLMAARIRLIQMPALAMTDKMGKDEA